MLKRKAFLSTVIVGIVALVVAACGGGDPTPTPRPTAISQVTPQPTATSALAPTATSAARQTATPTPTVVPPTATPSGPEPRYGGILQTRTPFDWPVWDTFHAFGGFSSTIVRNLLSNLIQFERTSLTDIEGDAAESWEVSGDGKTVTFRLRDDVVWDDGTPFTSADVVYTLGRPSSDFTFHLGRLAVIDTMDAPDDLTVNINLKRVSNAFISNIAGDFMRIYPAHVDIEDWKKSPVSNSAFVFSDRTVDQYIFDRNPNYFRTDEAGRALPYVDGLVYTIIGDSQLAGAAFRTGKLHCGCQSWAGDWISGFEEDLRKDVPGIDIQNYLGSAQALQFNLQRPPFNNQAFRQAFALFVDKELIASLAFNGSTFLTGSPLFPPENGGRWGLSREEIAEIPGYNPDHSVDVALAQTKLAESGLDPKDFKVSVIAGGFQGLAELITSALIEFGMEFTLTVTGGARQSVELFLNGAYDIGDLTMAQSIDDPSDLYRSRMAIGGVSNYGKYANERVTQLLADQDFELDPVKRKAMIQEVQRTELTDFPYVPMFWKLNQTATRPELKGFQTPPISIHPGRRLDRVWLEE